MSNLGSRSNVPRRPAQQTGPQRIVGDRVGIPPRTYTESFNKADGALGPDLTWVDVENNDATLNFLEPETPGEVVGNSYGVSGPPGATLALSQATEEVATSTMYAEAELVSVGTATGFLQFVLIRCATDGSDPDSGYVFRASWTQSGVTGPSFDLLQGDGSSVAVGSGSFPTTPSDKPIVGDVLRIEVEFISGSSYAVRGYKNGVLWVENSSDTATNAIGTSGGVGVAWNTAVGTSDLRLDNFEMGPL